MGIKKSTADICIFIDAGVLLSTRAIENHIEEHKNNINDSAVIGYNYVFMDCYL